jgi:hypothetical protein
MDSATDPQHLDGLGTFGRFPAEVRLMIYQLLFLDSEEVNLMSVEMNKQRSQPRSSQLLQCHSKIHKGCRDVLYDGAVFNAMLRDLDLYLRPLPEDRPLASYLIRRLDQQLNNHSLPSELEIQYIPSFTSLEYLNISFICILEPGYQITDTDIQPKSHTTISILTYDENSRQMSKSRKEADVLLGLKKILPAHVKIYLTIVPEPPRIFYDPPELVSRTAFVS